MYITDVISGTMADNDTNYLNNSSCPGLTVKPSVSLKTNRTLAHSRFGFATKRFLCFFYLWRSFPLQRAIWYMFFAGATERTNNIDNIFLNIFRYSNIVKIIGYFNSK